MPEIGAGSARARRRWDSLWWVASAYVLLGAGVTRGLNPHSLLTMLIYPAHVLLLVGFVRAVVELIWSEERGRVHPSVSLVLAALPDLAFVATVVLRDAG